MRGSPRASRSSGTGSLSSEYRPSGRRASRIRRTTDIWPLYPSAASVGTSRAAYFQLFIQPMAQRTRSGSWALGQVTAEYQSQPQSSHCGAGSCAVKRAPSHCPTQ